MKLRNLWSIGSPNWFWNYLTYDRSVRIILEHRPHEPDLEEGLLLAESQANAGSTVGSKPS